MPLIPTHAEAIETWRERIVANRQQVDDVREFADGADFYAPVVQAFRPPDPRDADDPVVAALRSLARPDDSWLDIGAGGGRYALPLARDVREVVAVEPSDAMLQSLREALVEQGMTNVRAIQAHWPMSDPPVADAALSANVLYDVEDVEEFLVAMEASARRLCVVVLAEQTPPTPIDRLWPEVHGVARAELPALREFLALLLARGTRFEVRLSERQPSSYTRPEDALTQARRHTWVQPGNEKDRRLQALLEERAVERDGRFALDWTPVTVGVVTWQPADVSRR